MTSNTLLPFRATVSQKLIANGSTFFDNTNDSILRELLQNSRRAGATRVDIWRDKEGKTYTYADNGRGCEPGELMQLGGSNWGPPVEGKETPAGVGFFSLARRNPIVSSPVKGWTVTLTEDHFCGKADIEPTAYPPDPAFGMVIQFDASTGRNAGYAITWPPLLRYLRGIEVYVDGEKKTADVDFFGEFEEICYHSRRYTDASGVEVVVGFADHPVHEYNLPLPQKSCIFNYQGYCLADDRNLLGNSWRDKNGKDGTHVVGQMRFLVPRESMLPLELPQRNEIIETDALQALLKRAKHELADLLLEGFKGDFNLSNPQWEELLADGYTGPVQLNEHYFRRKVRADNLVLDPGNFDVDIDDDKLTKTMGHLTPRQVLLLGDRAFRLEEDKMLHVLVQLPEPEDEMEFIEGYQFLELLYGARSSNSYPLMAAKFPEFFAEADRALKEVKVWDDLRISGEGDDAWACGYEGLFDGPDKASIDENILVQPLIDDEPVAKPFPVRALWDFWSSDVSNVSGIFDKAWFDELLAGGDIDDWVVKICTAAAHLRSLYDESWDDDSWSSEQQEEVWREELHEALALLSGKGLDLLKERIHTKVESIIYGMSKVLPIEAGKSQNWTITMPVFVRMSGAIAVGDVTIDTGTAGDDEEAE